VTIVVGGGPALISSANDTNIIYINDFKQIPISDGSAWHLEWDAPSEAPTVIQPVSFMLDQLRRMVMPETLRSAEKTGMFSWRSLDWISWIINPQLWLEGIRLAYHFQLETMKSAEERAQLNEDCAARCKANQQFMEKLNKDMNNELILPGKRGSLIIARDEGTKETNFIFLFTKCFHCS
jgi:hypothetical protein